MINNPSKYGLILVFTMLCFPGLADIQGAKDSEFYRSITASSAISEIDWDIDNDGRADALTDGLLFLRYSFGLSGISLINGLISDGSEFTSASDIERELKSIYDASGDIDGDGNIDALTDGLLLLRYLFGLSGESLTSGVVANGAVRTDGSSIGSYIGTLMPEAPYITLNGNAELNHEQATSYVDAGATAADFKDGSVTVTVTGSVDADEAGVYTLTYSAVDSDGNIAKPMTRTITVADTVGPVITINGETSMEINQDSDFSDPGATATDAVDGSVRVVTTGSVDPSAAGTYTLTYNAIDSAGNKSSLARTILVSSSKFILNVFSNGQVDPIWDEGINAADSGISWGSCDNGGDDCPNISWEIVQDTDRGSVLQVEHSSAGQQAIFYFKTSMGKNLSGYSGGQLVFDIKTISGNSNYSMKVDCVYPCGSSDQNIGVVGDGAWETVSIEIDDLVEDGLSLATVDTGFVIWATQYTSTVFQLDNVRWEDTDIGDGPDPEEPVDGDDGWIIPSFSGYESPNSYEGYDLVWSDEFDGSQLNSSDWGYDIGTGNGGWGNNELQYYTNRNLYLKDGLLVIRADEETFGGRSYTSSRIKTQGKKNFQYGRIDIRARMPEGQGMWPALWMLGENINQVSWPYCGEVDIMEMVGGGSGRDNRVVGTAHWNKGGLSASYDPVSFGTPKTMPENLSENFHVYSIAWTSNRMIWYVDDVQYHVMAIDNSDELAAFKKQFFLIFNVAVGGNWPGSPNSATVFPQRMVVDYVRVFQDENGSTGGQSAVTHPVPGLIEAEDYSDMSGIQVEASTDTGGGFNVGYIDSGDWLEFSIDVAEMGNYLVEYRLASQGGSNGFQTLVDGIQLDSQSVSDTGGWQSWVTNSASVNLNAGEQTLRVESVGNNWNLNWIKFTAQ